MDKEAQEYSRQILGTDLKCAECGKPINGHKHMKIFKKTYHMTCGMNRLFGENAKAVL